MGEVLYDKTGDIRDVNTVLVPLDKLRELQADAARYRKIRDVKSGFEVTLGGAMYWNEGLDSVADAAIRAAAALQKDKESQNG